MGFPASHRVSYCEDNRCEEDRTSNSDIATDHRDNQIPRLKVLDNREPSNWTAQGPRHHDRFPFQGHRLLRRKRTRQWNNIDCLSARQHCKQNDCDNMSDGRQKRKETAQRAPPTRIEGRMFRQQKLYKVHEPLVAKKFLIDNQRRYAIACPILLQPSGYKRIGT